jgi:aspartyl-tRNA(Asn)/glutamyl-tRNA(Gln) amidotransferase subunit A
MTKPFATVVDIAADIASGKTSAVEVLEQHLARITEREGEIHAFNLVTTEQARATAQQVDADIKAGKPVGPLAGVPVALKDNMCTRGMKPHARQKFLKVGSRHTTQQW